ncbi:LysR family transcriptional regulator [Pseudomonas matsuisoli]|uniref:LysR family transcriptional regulator n=1 Tax=Pseudomonas matsuisoli TaxID=1515666 RepID=A0A917PIR9_9PSED|nr:LysR family transcriptional regulator [Pseudomonas matsuisoli]GGJ80875.1 LysR family transcriptional regulator [Pseudomonas matsuisoli]
MIGFPQLRCFVAVATELHFGRAAQMLHMTQPPLSRQIQLLEQELGVALLERTSRSVSLTPAGSAFLVEARKLMEQSERAVQIARRAANTLSGTVTVGFIGSATYGFIPKLAERAKEELPNIHVNFLEMNSVEQQEALLFGRVDLGIIRPGPRAEGLESVCIEKGDLALAVARNHPLALRRQLVTLKQLDDLPFIMYSKVGRYFQGVLTTMFERAQVKPRYVQFMDQTHAILSLVSAGMGVAIVPEDARNACFENVVFKSLQTQTQYELHAIWRADDDGPAVAAVREIILRQRVSSQT